MRCCKREITGNRPTELVDHLSSEDAFRGGAGGEPRGARDWSERTAEGEGERRGEKRRGGEWAEWSGVGWSGPERDEGGGDDLKIALGILTDMPALEGAIGSNV